MATAVPEDVRVYPLSVERYERMVETGILGEDDRVELIRGVLAEMTPQGVSHAGVLQWLAERFFDGLDRQRFTVRVQMPLRLASTRSMPEPDLAVVAAGAYLHQHPETATLVIEVSDSSLGFDLTTKARVYAAAAIPELWVIDVGARRATVHRDPGEHGYVDVRPGLARLTPATAGLPEIDLGQLGERLA